MVRSRSKVSKAREVRAARDGRRKRWSFITVCLLMYFLFISEISL